MIMFLKKRFFINLKIFIIIIIIILIITIYIISILSIRKLITFIIDAKYISYREINFLNIYKKIIIIKISKSIDLFKRTFDKFAIFIINKIYISIIIKFIAKLNYNFRWKYNFRN